MVSTKYILQQFQSSRLSNILLQRQLLLYGEIARSPDDDVVRQTVFHENGIQIKDVLHRRRGRPRKTWNQEVNRMAMQCSEGLNLQTVVMDKDEWKRRVKSFCKAVN